MKKTIGIAGWSGSGKTTLVENLIKVFKNKYKLKVCTLKHAHKNFEIDKKGKDSYRFSKAGSDQVIISSSRQWAVINQLNDKEKDQLSCYGPRTLKNHNNLETGKIEAYIDF